MIEGKLPPQAVDVEKFVLGSVMIDREALDIALSMISHEVFYSISHQVIFKTIRKLAKKSNPVDILTVTNALKESGELDQAGGAVFITNLTSNVGGASHIQYHCLILLQKYIKREFIRIGVDMSENGFNESMDIEDIFTLLNTEQERLVRIIHHQSSANYISYFIDSARAQYHERERRAKEGLAPGIKTPVTDLTKTIGGWMDGDLVIIAGRPSMGKTAFALNAIKTSAKEGKWVNVYSLEMSGERLVDRLLCGEAGINHTKYRDGMLNAEEYEKIEKASEKFSDMKIFLDPTPIVNMEYILAKSRVMKRKGECDLIVIDYLQLVDKSNDRKNGTREQDVSDMSRKAKLLAQEIGVPVLLLAQLSRAVELRGGDKRPQLSDLRESGAIEQDADTVIFLYRAERYGINVDEEGKPTKGVGELIVSKQRNGSIGIIKFGYNEDLTQIFDYIKQEDDNPKQSFHSDVFIEPSLDFEEETPF